MNIIIFVVSGLLLASTIQASNLDNTILSRYLCRNKENGFRSLVPGSCSQYYECQNGKSLLRSCSRYYDSQNRICVNTNPGCVETVKRQISVPVSCTGPCCGIANGDYVVDSINSQIYYQCQDNCVATKSTCPGDLMFDLVKEECASPIDCGNNGGCITTTTQQPCTQTPEEVTTTTCTTTPCTTTPYTTDPTKASTPCAPTPKQPETPCTTTTCTTTTCTTTTSPTTSSPTTTTTTMKSTTTTTRKTTRTSTITTTTTTPCTTTTCTSTPCTTTTSTTTPCTTTTCTTTTCTTTTCTTTTCTTTTCTTCTTTYCTTTTCTTTTCTTTPCITTTKKPCTTTPCTTTLCATTTTKAPCASSNNLAAAASHNEFSAVSIDGIPYKKPSQYLQSNIDTYMRFACRDKPNGFMLASLKSCNEYYICRYGQALPVSCGNNYFNALKGICDLPENTNCMQSPKYIK